MKIIECPRDAMQGLINFVPTNIKINYLNVLLQCGFDTLDFGSFVSPKAVPQMADTSAVIKGLKLTPACAKLLAIVANIRGAKDACSFDEIKYLGFPFSISETFQKRNTNSTINDSLKNVEAIQSLCLKNGKELVIYISMAFGNPYGEPWNIEEVTKWVSKMVQLKINTIALADTTGVSNPENISYLFSRLIPLFPDVEFGAHFHTHPAAWEEKVKAAISNGCKRFDCAIKGYGGCPMAKDELVGNLATENLLEYLTNQKIEHQINQEYFEKAIRYCEKVFK